MTIAIEEDEQQVDADGADMGSEIKDTEVKVSGTDEMQAADSVATYEDDTAGLEQADDSQKPSSAQLKSLRNSHTESNLHGFELHRPSSKGTELLFQIIKATINTNSGRQWHRPGFPLLDHVTVLCTFPTSLFMLFP